MAPLTEKKQFFTLAFQSRALYKTTTPHMTSGFSELYVNFYFSQCALKRYTTTALTFFLAINALS